MSPAPQTTKTATALVLALMLTACGGAEPEQAADASDTAAADAQASPSEGTPEAAVELVDPMELAPDDLCRVLSEETLTELLGPPDDRAGSQESDAAVPDPEDVENLGGLSMTCITVATSVGPPPRSHSLTYRLEINEGPYQEDTSAPAEEDADPSIEIGDYAVVEVDPEGTDVDLQVVQGQVGVSVDYSATEVVDYEGVPYADEEEMVARALTAAEEILASTGA
ncbi:hypothetical protein KGD83_27870 [Nocardiopsis akebiae]|uniref:DUF3558 domain-containing protein n=1 Tax=Nocardiopsis akebiae TaxID=2831968 RepID=A0ABX8C3J3_9ACTN|nr:hypothetical protein [Nocardiopsis akebiae]QUX28959.1 hypothetical protein KGD83_27870 [Nocardiopsis akebiae]